MGMEIKLILDYIINITKKMILHPKMEMILIKIIVLAVLGIVTYYFTKLFYDPILMSVINRGYNENKMKKDSLGLTHLQMKMESSNVPTPKVTHVKSVVYSSSTKDQRDLSKSRRRFCTHQKCRMVKHGKHIKKIYYIKLEKQ